VLEGTIRHSGDLAVATCDRFDNGDPRRLRKLDRTRPIDVAVALAVQEATIEQPRSVYEIARDHRALTLRSGWKS
jgi:hypothetical protein